jgi:hypothetical protein
MGTEALYTVRAHQYLAPVVTIRNVPRGQYEQHERQKLRQPYKSTVEGIACQRVDLPPDGDTQHLPSKRVQNRAAA